MTITSHDTAAALREAFRQGWTDGAQLGEQSAREAHTCYPHYSAREVDAYTNGSIDGARGDAWRVDRLLAPWFGRTD